MFTRNPTFVAALLAAALFLPPLAAQEGPTPADSPRTITRTGEDGRLTQLTAVKQGESWHVDLKTQHPLKDGKSSSQQLSLEFQGDAATDAALKKLLDDPPQDPAAWAPRLEELAHVQIDFDVEGPQWQEDDQDMWLEELPGQLRDHMSDALDRARAEWRQVMRQLGHGPFSPWRGPTAGPSSDRIWLRNGDVVSGELLNIDLMGVRLATPQGEIQFARDQVRRIDFARPPTAVLGVTLTPAEGGVRVAAVHEGSPAAKAGIHKGDLITTLAGKPVPTARSLRELVWAHRPGETVKVAIERDGTPLELEVTLGSSLTIAPN